MLSTNVDLDASDTYSSIYNKICDSLRTTVPDELINSGLEFNYMYRIAVRQQVGAMTANDSIEIQWGFRNKADGECAVEGNPNLAYQ